MLKFWLVKEKGYAEGLVDQGEETCWRIGWSRKRDMLEDWLIKEKGCVGGLGDQ